MPDFTDYPKQWILSRTALPEARNGKCARFDELHIQAAADVPITRLVGAAGHEAGRLIGWVIADGRLIDSDSTLTLAEGETVETLYDRLGGRFILLWRDGDRLRLRMDVAGGMSAIFAPDHGIAAATTSLLGAFVSLQRDTEVAGIFDFPKNRGFLPFGLTASQGVTRLLPNFDLDLARFETRRFWPHPEAVDAPKLDRTAARDLAREAAQIMQRNVHAVLAAGTAERPVTLYLSGGVDSRMVLAAARGRTDHLVSETIGGPESMDAHVAARLARIAGIPHRRIAPVPTPPDRIADWLHRTGETLYDPVTDISATAEAHPPPGHALTGTVCDLSKAKHFETEDIGAPGLDVATLLKRIRMPDTPRLSAAAQDWLDSFPAASAAYALDLSKIETIYGCWSSVAGYGHALPRPSLSPFASRRLFDIVFAVPYEYRRDKGFLKDYMNTLWPDLMALPLNRASGLARLRFLKTELRDRVPTPIKRALKPLR